MTYFVSGFQCGIHTAQIHICSHDEGNAIEECIPVRHFLRRGLVLCFQRRLGQLAAIIWHSHDLKLRCPGVVTGQDVHRQPHTAISVPIWEQLGIRLLGRCR